MRSIEELTGPSDADLWAIEAEADLLAAELALVDAEAAWYAHPGPETAADYLAAVTEVVDLHDLCAHRTAGAVA